MTRTLHVTIGETSDRSDLEATLGTIDSGEDIEPQDSRLSIENLETFGRIFRPTNLELLEAIVEHDPGSIRELARIVDRHPPRCMVMFMNSLIMDWSSSKARRARSNPWSRTMRLKRKSRLPQLSFINIWRFSASWLLGLIIVFLSIYLRINNDEEEEEDLNTSQTEAST